MSNGSWNGIATTAPAASGVIGSPENCPHYYADVDGSGTFILQVIAVGYDSQGNIPDDPPVQYQAPGYHRAALPSNKEPKAAFDGSGKCITAGYDNNDPALPWYNIGDQSGHPSGTGTPAAAAALVALGTVAQYIRTSKS